MFAINEDLSIYATRGDTVFFEVSAEENNTGTAYSFEVGDVLRMKVMQKKNAANVVLEKYFRVEEKCQNVYILLTGDETKFGGIISKPTDYWYEIELNPDTNPQTIVGFDDEGAKIFRLYPEGADVEITPGTSTIVGGIVKSINGVSPDESGNVDVQTGDATKSDVEDAVSDFTQNLIKQAQRTTLSINLCDGKFEYGYLSETGDPVAATPTDAAFRTTNYIPVKGGRRLCWNGDADTVPTNTAKVVQYDEDCNCIVELTDVPTEVNRWTANGIVLNAKTKFVRVAFYTSTPVELTSVKLNLFYYVDLYYAFASPGATFQHHPYRESTATVADLLKYHSPLAGKTICYDGDSICESRLGKANANLNNGGGYAKLIADRVGGMYENYAQGGATLARCEGSPHCLVDDIEGIAWDCDLYCFEGGLNDFWNDVPIGTFIENDYTSDYDVTTISGALETIFRYATTQFLGKPVCFVIPHKIVELSDKNNVGMQFRVLYTRLVGICEKWAIPYYNAYKTSGLRGANEAQNEAYLNSNASGVGDGCHLNEEGYKRYYVPQLIKLFEQIMPVE